MNKTEWLSLKLRCEIICSLVYQLDSAEEDSLVLQLVSELDSEITFMRIMISQVVAEVASSPVEAKRQECLS